MNKQSLIAILLTVLMSMTGVKAFAYDIAVANNDGVTIYYSWHRYSINDDIYTELTVIHGNRDISDYSNEYTGNLVIPEYVDYNGETYPVTQIGSYAFDGCSGLTSVTIPKSVTSIGEYVFKGCCGLTSVIINCSPTTIGSSPFDGCTKIEEVSFDCETVTSLFSYFSNIKKVTLSENIKTIGGNAFYGCSGLTSLTIPNSVTSIGSNAFYGCSGLTSLTIPNSVTSIGSNAFCGCSGLTSVIVNCSPNYIGESPFYGCTHIEEVSFDCETVTSLFRNLSNIKKVTLSENVKTIGQSAFEYCRGLTSIIIPISVTYIGESAFYGCSKLVSVKVPVTDLSAFCSNIVIYLIRTVIGKTFQLIDNEGTEITEYIVPNDVTSIGNRAFYECNSLTSVTIGNSVASIGESAFYGCSGLTSINIPNSVTSIGEAAFQYCRELTSVIIGSGVLTIGSNAFNNTNLKKTIWLTNTPPSGYNNASGAVNYVSNDQFSISNKVVYKYLSSHFVVDGIRYVPVSPSDHTCDAIDCTYDASIENVNIGETVTNKGVTLTIMKVNPYTCYGNKYVKDFKLGWGGDIGDYAFCGCNNMETVELGQNISSIGGSSFSGCSKLKSIVIPDAVSSLGSYAFQGCSAMASAKIGNGVVTINEYAFSGCSSLTAMTIPQAVTTIGNNVFYYCTSLAKVTIADSESSLTLGSNGSNPIFSSCPLDYVYIGRDISYQTSSKYGYSPFYRNTTLREVKIADKETDISDNEFYGCTNLETVTIGDGVTTIGKWAFSGCSSLKYFTFGTKLENIGQEAFSDCTALVQITSRAKAAPACGSQALEDINKWECKLNVPKGYLAVYKAADQWMDFWFMEEGEYIPPLKGDVNSDGKVDKNDLRDLVEYIMGNKPNGVTEESADVNGDNKVNVADVVALTTLLK